MNVKEKCNNVEKRILYFDYLRILATLAVIVLHISAQNWYSISVSSFEWKVFTIFDSSVRWAVPIFVMISGGLFLDNDRKIDIKKIFKVNILTKITSFVFWMYMYAIYRFVVKNTLTVLSVFEGNYHMWFLYMLIGLYIMIPVLRKITESKKIMEYFLIILFIFSFLIPSLINILKCINNLYIMTMINAFESIYDNFNFLSTLGYVFYFVLGFYLYKYDIKVIFRKIIYVLGVVGFFLTYVLTEIYSNIIGEASVLFYLNSSINVLLMSICIFIFGKYVLSKIVLSEKGNMMLLKISNLTYGMYLVHVLIMDFLSDVLGLNTLTFNPLISIIIISLLVTIISYCVSFVMNCIPFLKKYVV